MLSFDIRALESQAASVEGELPADDPIWEEGDPLPETAIDVAGRLSAAGPSRFYFSGRLQGSVAGECRRCLAGVSAPVDVATYMIFAEAGVEGTDDESEAFVIDPGATSLDMRPAVREEWLLAAPAFPLCRPDCKGLCPRCGADLNAGACDCPPTSDARWDALRKHAPPD